MEVDAAHAICPDCPTTEQLALHTVEKQQKQADTSLPFSRLSARAAAAAVAKAPSLAPIGEAVGGATGSPTSLGSKEGRRLGNKAGSSSNNDWKHGSPSIQDSSPLFSSTGAAFAFEADGGGERKGAKKKRGVAGGQGTIGRAAAMADLHECSGGKGGALNWFKDRLSSTIAANNRLDGGRGVMDWEGMD